MGNNQTDTYPLEAILHRFDIHPFILALPVGMLIGALVCPGALGTWYFFIRIFILIICLFITFSRTLTFSDSDHRVTKSRFYFRTHIINRRSRFVLISEIKSVEVKQPFWGKVFGYGTLLIGTSEKTYSFHYISEPAMSKIILDELALTNNTNQSIK